MISMWVILSIDVLLKESVELTFVQGNYIVKEFAPNIADNPFGIWVLQGSPFSGCDCRNTGIVKNLLESSRLENGIIIVDDVFRYSVIWSHITELLHQPKLIWRISDRSMNDSYCPMMKDD